MKKTLLLALAVMACALFCQASSADKKDKKKKKGKQEQVSLPLTNRTDSLSYAMGMEATNGLIPYLVNSLGVDTAYIGKFVEGFNTFTDKTADQ